MDGHPSKQRTNETDAEDEYDDISGRFRKGVAPVAAEPRRTIVCVLRSEEENGKSIRVRALLRPRRVAP